MFDPRLPRIPRKGRSRTCLVRHRLKIDKLVVSSCSGGEINRRDGLTRAWNHFRGPFCPNRSNQDQNRVPIPRILSKFGFEEDKSVSLPLLSYPCRILESFARIIDRVGGDENARDWKSNEFCKNFTRNICISTLLEIRKKIKRENFPISLIRKNAIS